MEKQEQEILKAIENDSIFDYIANNYWNMSRDMLKAILLEYIYALYEVENHRVEPWEAVDNVIENLKDLWG